MGTQFEYKTRETAKTPSMAPFGKTLQARPASGPPELPRYLVSQPPVAETSKTHIPVHESEGEADRLAEQAMRMNEPADALAPGGEGPPENAPGLKVSGLMGGGIDSSKVPKSVQRVLSAPGEPLDSGTRGYFESRFKRNLAQVRVHAGKNADEAAQSMDALAFTVGRNIVFARDRYAPASGEGRKLLAHELSHTLQQQSTDKAPDHPGWIQRQSPNSIQGAVGELIADQVLDQEGLYVFRDWSKHVNDNGFDSMAYNPRTGRLWLMDNKAQGSTIAEVSSLTTNFRRNLDVARTYLMRLQGSNEGAAALAALEEGAFDRVVSNALSKGNAGFSERVFAEGLMAYDVRLGRLYSTRYAWLADMQQGGFMVGRRRYSSSDRILGPRRGFATVGGMIFTLIAIGGVVYAISEAEDKPLALLQVTTEFIVGGLVYRAAGGLGMIALASALTLCSDNAAMQQECERRAVVMRFFRQRLPSAIITSSWGPFVQEEVDPDLYQEAYDLLFNTEPIVLEAPAPEPTAAPMPGARPMDPSSPPPMSAPVPAEPAAPTSPAPSPAPAAGARPYGATAPPPPRYSQAPANPGASTPAGSGAPRASQGAGTASSQEPSAPRWPLSYEELGQSKHFQIIPEPSVANGTWSIVQPTNPGAIFRVQTRPDQGLELVTADKRVVAQLERSTLLAGGYRLVSGPLKLTLEADFQRWRAQNRAPELNDLVSPQLHFK